MSLIYLDNNATTRPDPAVVAAMLPYLTEFWGNPSSVHRFGQHARRAVDVARGQVARLIGASESEVIFTAGGTESINTAIRSLLAARRPRRKVVTSAVEHSATRELLESLARPGPEAIVLRVIPVDAAGRIDVAAVAAEVDDETALVSLMWGNNETGVIFPVREVAQICRERKVPFHCDGTQAAGKIPIDVAADGMDMLSLAAHKFHGPKGVGALWVRRGVRIGAQMVGGPQERGRRGGTENVAGIVGTGVAAEIAGERLGEMPRVAAMRDRLESRLLEIEQTRVNGGGPRLPNTTNVSFRALSAEAVLLLLSEQHGVCASAGAACSSGSLEPSHVIRAMGVPEDFAHGAVRFSLSRDTTDAEVDAAARHVAGVVRRLREVLPGGGL